MLRLLSQLDFNCKLYMWQKPAKHQHSFYYADFVYRIFNTMFVDMYYNSRNSKLWIVETGPLFYYVICVHRTMALDRLTIEIRCLTIVAECHTIKPGSHIAVIAGDCCWYMCRRLPQVICSQIHSFGGNHAGSQTLIIESSLLLLFSVVFSREAVALQKCRVSSNMQL